jgi:hypothetical protein
MNVPIRHHFVPRMLLRGFTASDETSEKVWCISRDGSDEPRLVDVGNIALVKHFYTMYRDRPNKEADVFWEKLLGEWEGRASESLRALDQSPDQLQGPIGLLIFLQLLRTPMGQAQLGRQAAAERARIFGDPDARVQGRWWYARKGRIPSFPEYQVLMEAAAAVRAGEEHSLLTVDTTVILDEMLTVVRHSGFGERLFDKGHWDKLEDDRGFFVIGDEPVSYLGQDNPAQPLWAQGRLPATLTLPVSSTRCLQVSRRADPVWLDDELIEHVNLRAFEWADRFVLGRDPELLQGLRERWREVGCRTPPPLPRDQRRRR